MRDLKFLISRNYRQMSGCVESALSPRLSNDLFVSTLSDAKR
jgi:hypothetical protein